MNNFLPGIKHINNTCLCKKIEDIKLNYQSRTFFENEDIIDKQIFINGFINQIKDKNLFFIINENGIEETNSKTIFEYSPNYFNLYDFKVHDCISFDLDKKITNRILIKEDANLIFFSIQNFSEYSFQIEVLENINLNVYFFNLVPLNISKIKLDFFIHEGKTLELETNNLYSISENHVFMSQNIFLTQPNSNFKSNMMFSNLNSDIYLSNNIFQKSNTSSTSYFMIALNNNNFVLKNRLMTLDNQSSNKFHVSSLVDGKSHLNIDLNANSLNNDELDLIQSIKVIKLPTFVGKLELKPFLTLNKENNIATHGVNIDTEKHDITFFFMLYGFDIINAKIMNFLCSLDINLKYKNQLKDYLNAL